MGSMKTWLTAHCRLAGAEATRLVRAGRRHPALPGLQAAYASGAVTAAHVQVVTAAVTPARVSAAADAGIYLATTDRLLTEAARALGPEDTEKAVRRWVAGVSAGHDGRPPVRVLAAVRPLRRPRCHRRRL